MHSTAARPDTTAAEATFRVMGTDAHLLVVDGPTDAIDAARARLDSLEDRWSRFRPTSELCRLNDRAGVPVVVSPLTFELIERACDWWELAGGAFDPTVLDALERAGYDRSFEMLVPDQHPAAVPSSRPVPGCADIDLDPVVHAVTLPPGVRIDLGGIAKGFAADLVADEVMRSGASGVCVNLGGDLRVIGRPPAGADAWVIAVDAPPGLDLPGRAAPALVLADGAVATTSRVQRTWRRGATVEHHVIDPRTGSPARTPWVSATVVAARAVDAEPLAKAALLAPDLSAASRVLATHGATGVLIGSDGELHMLAGADRFLVDDADPHS